MGGAVRSARNAASSVVATAKDAVSTLKKKPIQGAVKVAELPISTTLAPVAAIAPDVKGLPIVGTVAKGAVAGNSILSTVEGGSLPSMADVKAVVAAEGAVAGVDGGGVTGAAPGDTGFDFSSFLSAFESSGKAPRPGNTVYQPVGVAGGGFSAPASSGVSILTIALLGGLAVGGFYLWKRR